MAHRYSLFLLSLIGALHILTLYIHPVSGQADSIEIVSTASYIYDARPVATSVMPSPTSEQSTRSHAPSAVYGWQRFESIDLVQMVGFWELKNASNASDSAYHRSNNAGAILRYPFNGSGLRIGYRVQNDGAGFRIVIDGQTVSEINTNQEGLAYSTSTAEIFLDDGYHLLDIISLVETDGAGMVGIDYVEVFSSPPVPYVEGDAQTALDLVVDVSDYSLVQAPPTLLPSPSPPVPSLVTVDVVVAYDLNANDVADPNEGVRGISLRVVDAHTNNLLASAVTDDAGFVRIQVVSERDLRLVVSLLGETELVQVRREQGVTSTWDILLSPANLPGLIP